MTLKPLALPDLGRSDFGALLPLNAHFACDGLSEQSRVRAGRDARWSN